MNPYINDLAQQIRRTRAGVIKSRSHRVKDTRGQLRKRRWIKFIVFVVVYWRFCKWRCDWVRAGVLPVFDTTKNSGEPVDDSHQRYAVGFRSRSFVLLLILAIDEVSRGFDKRQKLNGEQLIRRWRGGEISSGKGNWWLVSAVISTLCRKKTTKTERFGVKARGRWIETPLKKQMVIFLSPFTPKGCSGLWRYSILVHARALTSEMLETWVVRIVVITGAFEYPQAVHLKV